MQVFSIIDQTCLTFSTKSFSVTPSHLPPYPMLLNLNLWKFWSLQLFSDINQKGKREANDNFILVDWYQICYAPNCFIGEFHNYANISVYANNKVENAHKSNFIIIVLQ